MSKNKSVITVTMAPTLERLCKVPRIVLGGDHAPATAKISAGGPGLFVAKALGVLEASLGDSALVVGLVGGCSGDRIAEELARSSVKAELVRIRGESPALLSFFDENAALSTRFLEPCPEVGDDELDELLDLLRRLAPGFKVACLCGPLLPGAPRDFYARLVSLFRAYGVKAIMDATGDCLKASLGQKPAAVMLGLGALSELAGFVVSTVNEAIDAAGSLVARGVGLAAVFMGGRGALILNRLEAVLAEFSASAPFKFNGPGDSFLAALAWSMAMESDIEEMARAAVAASAAAALSPQPGIFSLANYKAIAPKVAVTRLA